MMALCLMRMGVWRVGDEQQAVPVAQQDIEFAEKFGNLWLEGSTVAKMALAHQVALHRRRMNPLPCKSGEGAGQAFRSMDTWDCRDEIVMLLVDYREDGDHALDDADIAITVGHNNDHNIGEGEGQGWQFAGWCWTHDHYVEGKGKPVGWMPLPHILARAYAAFDGEPASTALTPDATQTREAETRSAIVRDLIAERRSYKEDSPTWRAFGFCIEIAEQAALNARGGA